MGYHKEFPVGTAERLEGLLKEAGDNEAFRRVQSVYFRAKFGYPAPQIAAMTGYSVGTVRNVHSAFLRDGFAIFDLGRPGGRQVALSTVYDLLHRHGWRKIQPRSRHPKADKEAQADFKKMA